MKLIFLPYCLLTLSLLLGWWGAAVEVRQYRIPLWSLMLMLAVVVAWGVGVVTPPGLFWAALFWAVLYYYQHSPVYWLSQGCLYALFALCYLMATHALPGFKRQVIFEDYWHGTSVFPSSLYTHFDLGFLGVVLFCSLADPLKTGKQWLAALKSARWLPLILFALFVVAEYIWLVPDPKWNTNILWQLLAGLLFVVIAEEAFFRLLLQRQIEKYLGGTDPESVYVAIFATALLSTLWNMGERIYVEMYIFYFLSGLFYAYVYGRTRSIELTILMHLVVNALHMIFFVYPGV